MPYSSMLYGFRISMPSPSRHFELLIHAKLHHGVHSVLLYYSSAIAIPQHRRNAHLLAPRPGSVSHLYRHPNHTRQERRRVPHSQILHCLPFLKVHAIRLQHTSGTDFIQLQRRRCRSGSNELSVEWRYFYIRHTCCLRES